MFKWFKTSKYIIICNKSKIRKFSSQKGKKVIFQEVTFWVKKLSYRALSTFNWFISPMFPLEKYVLNHYHNFYFEKKKIMFFLTHLIFQKKFYLVQPLCRQGVLESFLTLGGWIWDVFNYKKVPSGGARRYFILYPNKRGWRFTPVKRLS